MVFVSKPLACSMSCMRKHLKAVHSQLILHSFSFLGNYFKTKRRLARVRADIKRILWENPKYHQVPQVSLSLPSHDIALRNIWWTIFSDTSEWRTSLAFGEVERDPFNFIAEYQYLNVHSFIHIYERVAKSRNKAWFWHVWALILRASGLNTSQSKLEWSKLELVRVFLHQRNRIPSDLLQTRHLWSEFWEGTGALDAISRLSQCAKKCARPFFKDLFGPDLSPREPLYKKLLEKKTWLILLSCETSPTPKPFGDSG